MRSQRKFWISAFLAGVATVKGVARAKLQAPSARRCGTAMGPRFLVLIMVVFLTPAEALAQEGQVLFSRNGETLRLLNKVDLGDVAAGRYVMRMTEYSMEPGAKIASHVHKGPGLRYVVEGSIAIEHAKGDKIEIYQAGSTYYEPAGPHYGGYNASPGRARVIIVELLPFE